MCCLVRGTALNGNHEHNCSKRDESDGIPAPGCTGAATVRLIGQAAVQPLDLAVSVDVATPALSDDALRPVLGLLSDLAVRRHGAVAVLRALSRAERAPASIAAF